MYGLHCAIVEQINYDKLKGLLLFDTTREEGEEEEGEEGEEGEEEADAVAGEEILDAEDLEDPMDVVNA
jgi:hypothetical protein